MTPALTATVNNQPIEDAAALDAIEAMPEAQKVDFAFNVATGPVYRVADLEIKAPPRTHQLSAARSQQAQSDSRRAGRLGQDPGDRGRNPQHGARQGLRVGFRRQTRGC